MNITRTEFKETNGQALRLSENLNFYAQEVSLMDLARRSILAGNPAA